MLTFAPKLDGHFKAKCGYKFKLKTGVQYHLVLQYKKCRKKPTENKLLYSDLRVGEIADELGFNDESHLNKIFKKHKGTTASLFRKTPVLN
nr:helix-turn-helix domain-containing protein [Flavobacterium sp. ASV13]